MANFRIMPRQWGNLVRLILFIACYFLIIFGHPLLTKALYGYWITYHEPYQIFILPFLLIFLASISWPRLRSTALDPQNWRQTWWCSLIVLTLILIRFPTSLTDSPTRLLVSYVTLLTITVLFTWLAIFPIKFIHRFSWSLGILMPILPISFLMLVASDLFWKPITLPLTVLIAALLHRLFPAVTTSLMPNTSVLNFNGFVVSIGPACTGVASMTIFTILFGATLLATSQWYQFKKTPTLLAFLGGLAALFFFNLVRVTTLLIIGAFYSSELALKLFHEFFMAVIVLTFSVLYLYKIFPRLIVKKPGLGIGASS